MFIIKEPECNCSIIAICQLVCSRPVLKSASVLLLFYRVDERKPMKIPPDTTSYNYLEILEKNDSCKVPTNPHANEKNSLERTTNNTAKEEKVNNNKLVQ